MIGFLKWEVIDLEDNNIILLTNSWIGYWVWISSITFSQISLNSEVELYVYHHIVEWWQSLFGFLEKSEKQIFEQLIKISWIWGKVAIQILSLWVSRLSQAIVSEDKKVIESIKWIWKKMAEKIILELKDKDFIKNHDLIWGNSEITNLKINLNSEKFSDVKSTLVNMWYNSVKVEKTLANLPEWLNKVEDIIVYVVKNI
jgi:Holliday junction DNA helicase RuvA